MATRMDRSPGRLSARLYRASLWVLPRELRVQAGDEMEQTFRSMWAADRRPGARALLVAILVLDLVQTARWARRQPKGGATDLARRLPTNRRPTLGTRLEDSMNDFRHGLRSLIKNPAFSTVALLVLALGVGANATILTMVDALFLTDPPHVEKPDRLVRVMRTSDSGSEGSLAYPDFQHYRDNNEVFTDLAAYDEDGFSVTFALGDERTSTTGWFVTDNYFRTLGVRAVAGRFFLPEENVVASPRSVAVISERFWARTFDRSESAIGAVVRLNGNPFEVIGIVPADFRGLSPLEEPPEVFVPVVTQPILAPLGGNYALERVQGAKWVWLRGIGRLAPGETVETASANLGGLARYLEENFAAWSDGWGIALTPHVGFNPSDRAGLISVTRLLFGAVLLLLIIVAANIAILMLARSSERSRETGVRLALGAGRVRIARRVLAENLSLAIGAGLLGVGMARLCGDLAAAWMPMTLSVGFRPSLRVALVAVCLAVLVAVAASLAPVMQGGFRDLNGLLRGRSEGLGSPRLRAVLVVVQVALSLMLVVGATLFARSVATARAVDLGFATEDRVVVQLNLRNHGYDAEAGRALVERALERLRALPEVDSVTTTARLPFLGVAMTGFSPVGRERTSSGVLEGTASDASSRNEGLFSGFNQVGPDYFETMEMPIVRGRGIERGDVLGAPGVVVINERLAERAFPDEEAIGQQIQVEEGEPALTVIGIARDATYYELGEEPATQFWLASQQTYFSSMVRFVLATRGAPASVGNRAREVLLELDPGLAVPAPKMLDETFRTEIGRYRTAARVVSMFGLLALLLASVGLYGVLTYSVVQRKKEIGIRVALGATRSRVASGVVRHGVRLALVGVVLGLAGALVATRFVVSFLYGVEPTDAVTFAAAPSALLLVTVLACLVPARRAATVDPVRVIRAD